MVYCARDGGRGAHRSVCCCDAESVGGGDMKFLFLAVAGLDIVNCAVRLWADGKVTIDSQLWLMLAALWFIIYKLEDRKEQ